MAVLSKELRERTRRNLERMRDDLESDWHYRLMDTMAETGYSGKSLSPVEKNVLLWTSHGLSAKEISFKLERSELTIKSHLRSVNSKLAARNKVHAVAIALREGLIK